MKHTVFQLKDFQNFCFRSDLQITVWVAALASVNDGIWSGIERQKLTPPSCFWQSWCFITSITTIEKQTKALTIVKSSSAVQPVFQIFLLCFNAEHFISSKQPATCKELLPHDVQLFSLSILKFHFSLWIFSKFHCYNSMTSQNLSFCL